MTTFDFEDILRHLHKDRRPPTQDTYGDRIQQKVDRRRSAVCQLGHHVLCTGSGRDGGPCRCIHHEVGD